MGEELDDGATLDLLFILDSTASMGSYIESAKNNIVEICSILAASGRLRSQDGLQIGLIAYRDYPIEENDFVVKPHAFTYNVKEMEEYLAPIRALGGGDRPEAFSTALEFAFTKMNGWRDEALKAFVVTTDAAPHGIKERDDSFPDGGPRGVTVGDPIKLAREMAFQGYSIFTLACEPTLGNTTEYAIDFYKALSDMTLGVFCALTDHRLLAACLIGSLLERIDLRKLSEEYQADIAKRVLEDHLSIDEVVEELHGKLTYQGHQVTTLQVDDIYNNLPAAKHNYKTFLGSNSLSDASRLLKRVFSRRHNSVCMRAVQESKSSYGDERGIFSTVAIRFRNLGAHRISLKMFDAELRSMSEDIVLPDNFTIVRTFKINIPVNFVLTCGPRIKNFSRTFDKEQDIDLDQIFNYS
ncbi:hypothetical protein ACEPAI_4332 [Sanghuangporus weigelae]